MRKVYVFFASLLLLALHIPATFAKIMSVDVDYSETSMTAKINASISGMTAASSSLYDSLKLSSLGLARQAFDYAYQGFSYLKQAGKLENENILSIVDFSEPSFKKRLFVIDLNKMEVLFNTYVAHGLNSGKAFAQRFSNSVNSYQSSLGFYETETTYNGKNGYSLHLQGLERGINDNAYKREIVVHGADYVNEQIIHARGYIGRSWGCPAIPEKLHIPIINTIKNGTCLFIFSPDKNYVKQSKILRVAAPAPSLAYN